MFIFWPLAREALPLSCMSLSLTATVDEARMPIDHCLLSNQRPRLSDEKSGVFSDARSCYYGVFGRKGGLPKQQQGGPLTSQTDCADYDDEGRYKWHQASWTLTSSSSCSITGRGGSCRPGVPQAFHTFQSAIGPDLAAAGGSSVNCCARE